MRCSTFVFLFSAALLGSAVLVGCADRSVSGDAFELQGYSGHFTVTKVEPANTKGKSLVYGWIEFDPRPKRYFVNLSCVALKANDMRSEKIYIDNVAHVIPTRLEVAEDTRRFHVYWMFGVSELQDLVESQSAGLQLIEDCDLLVN